MIDIKIQGTHINDIVYLVTDAMGAPVIDHSKSACAVLESFLSEDATCYRVCGPIPSGHSPSRIEYFTRISDQGDDTPWEPCDGNECQGEQLLFQSDTSTLCGQLRLYNGHGENRDLMVKVTLTKP